MKLIKVNNSIRYVKPKMDMISATVFMAIFGNIFPNIAVAGNETNFITI